MFARSSWFKYRQFSWNFFVSMVVTDRHWKIAGFIYKTDSYKQYIFFSCFFKMNFGQFHSLKFLASKLTIYAREKNISKGRDETGLLLSILI